MRHVKRPNPSVEWTVYESPLGALTVSGGSEGIGSVYFPGRSPHLDGAFRRPMTEAIDQLDEYFAGERKAFDLPLNLVGSHLQKLVWARLRQIPYGSTISYGELAGQIEESAFPAGLEPYQRVRAAAAEIGRTPTPILVPCHRVIGADGSLTGYGGGLQRKRALLELEGCDIAGPDSGPSQKADQLALL
jgi:methylated-DNA-[protein]-cysteine S-methyltransferase